MYHAEQLRGMERSRVDSTIELLCRKYFLRKSGSSKISGSQIGSRFARRLLVILDGAIANKPGLACRTPLPRSPWQGRSHTCR